MWLLNGEPAPSDSTITRFMRGHLAEVIEDLHYQFIEMLYEMEHLLGFSLTEIPECAIMQQFLGEQT